LDHRLFFVPVSSPSTSAFSTPMPFATIGLIRLRLSLKAALTNEPVFLLVGAVFFLFALWLLYRIPAQAEG